MFSHMSSVKKILPLLICLVMLAGGAALCVQDVAAQAPEAPAAVAPEAAAAPAPPKIDTGDTAWVLVSTALVLAMTAPGVTLFYGGMVRSKNAMDTIMQSFIILCLISVQWVLWGYSLAFGPDKGHIIGGLEWFGLNGVGLEPNADYAATIPHQAFMLFQMMFAVITPALITGAFAERMKFSGFLLFTLLWATFIYDPLAHWVWGVGGWVRNLGALDFAGGTVVHISSGIAGLACAIVVKQRMGLGKEGMHSEQFAHDPSGRILALVWMVRVQRRQRVERRGTGDQHLYRHQYGDGYRGAVLDDRGVDLSRQTVGLGRGKRGGGGVGGHHACVGVRRPDLVDLDRDRSWCVVLCGGDVEADVWL